MTLPPGFIEMMRSLLGDDSVGFLHSMEQPPCCSVRLNSRKPGAVFPDAQPVKWCQNGLYLADRPTFTLDPLFHGGAYYVQDASSMIYSEVTKRIIAAIGSNNLPLCVADLCAAPGGKTTAMIDALPDGSKVVANDVVPKRAAILRENITKWGFPGVSVLNTDISFFKSQKASYDIVAVDAPCSGEGMMRKEPVACTQWSPALIEECARLQREILTNAVPAIKPGGFLIYSTCTFNRTENEENAHFICERLGLEPFDPSFPEEWGIPRGIGTHLPAYRFMPHKTKGEGLFLAVFRKPGEWNPSHLIASSRKDIHISLPHKGRGDRRAFGEVPEMDEILSVDFDKDKYPIASLSKEQALAYLRREAIVLPPETPKGIVIVSYNGLPLGPVKNIGNRANNLYPKNWRIRMN